MKPWTGIVSEQEEEIYRLAGFDKPAGMGRRPALLIIDTQYRSIGHTPQPLPAALAEYPTSCGEAGWRALEPMERLLSEFRANGWPVLYPHVAPKQASDGGRLAAKNPSMMAMDARGYRIVDEVAPRAGDIVLPKKHPSAFFATALVSHLIDFGVDTLVVTGCTTSGCVRASVVDAFAYNFRVTVASDAVFDRSPTSHAVNLFDMAQKFADVMPAAEVIAALRGIAST